MTTKLPREPRNPEGTFGFLGIPCGDTIEFLHKGIFLDGPEEKFTVADQDRSVTWEYDGWSTTHKLKYLTDELVLKRDPKANLNYWALRFWIHCDTEKKLSEIYKEKKRQYYAQRTDK